MTKTTSIQQRLQLYVGRHVLIYTDPSGTVEGKLLNVMEGWLYVQEDPNVVSSSESYKGAIALLAIRRIVHFRVYPERVKPAKKIRRKK